jgi:hypothetical protein
VGRIRGVPGRQSIGVFPATSLFATAVADPFILLSLVVRTR